MDEAKSHSMVKDIEKDARAGSKSTEKDVKEVVSVIQNLEDFLNAHGPDPAFHTVNRDGKVVNVLKHPGPLTQTPVISWVEDLKTHGVNDGHGGRLPLCPHDTTDMDWSCDAVMKFCSPSLAKEVKKELTFEQENGPKLC